MPAPGMHSGVATDDALNLSMSEHAIPLYDAVKTFIRTRRDDRIGLVVFSDNPYVISPLTFDHEYLLHYIDFVDDKLLRDRLHHLKSAPP